MKRSSKAKQAKTFPPIDNDTGNESEEKPTVPTVDTKTKLRSLKTRTISSVALIASFVGFIYAGHVPLMFLILILQTLVANELFKLSRVATQEKKVPYYRLQKYLPWYFFFVAIFWLHLRFIHHNLLLELSSDRRFARAFFWLVKHHELISYVMYMGGFILFVLSLRRGRYLYQFGQFAWTHMVLLVTTAPSSFFVSNIFKGIIWYILPSFLVIANDICAYLAGIMFGKTPLIRLSPKKTVEGFVGGLVGTAAVALVLADVLSRSQWMVCPRHDLTVFGPLTCVPDEVFIPRLYHLAALIPASLNALLSASALPLLAAVPSFTFMIRPIQIHAVALAVFASLIAPFGGFFASGFKRALGIKDFGDTIPGHGGLTDRFDCQVIIAIFSHAYYKSYIATPVISLAGVLTSALALGVADQKKLLAAVANVLASDGNLPSPLVDSIVAAAAAVNDSSF
uniref:Phosphatidate cytidylyltransferase n=1 Tax=Polytomella parva TaxID=51329 RepID=A0A7S0VIE3_9CHLO|mmetsp:Transcript_6747/g.13238  ORF Transcript_6747/g.13238 Transcript_6747/m.13238 type:complete len:454 (+) Transcript_6747:71-1432(+)